MSDKIPVDSITEDELNSNVVPTEIFSFSKESVDSPELILDSGRDLRVKDDLLVDGDGTVSGDLTVGGTLDVTGVVTCESTVDIKDDTEVEGQLTISGASRVRVTSTAGQSIPDATSTKITFGTEIEDNLEEWSSDTFTALKAGRYMVSCMILFTAAQFSVGNIALLSIYIDNGFYAYIDREEFQANLAGYTPSLSGTKVVELGVGGTIDIRTYQDEGAARSLTSGAGYVWLDIHRLS